MKKAAVILATGYEEGEALFVVDILRRGGVECDSLGLESLQVTGAHDITALADKVFDGSLDAYDMVVLPGGMGGALAMRDHEGFQAAVKKMYCDGKLVAAICAAPLALDHAGLLEGKRYTCFPTTAGKIEAEGAEWVDELVVRTDNLIFSQGPGTTLAFAYYLVSALGGDGDKLAQAMLYNRALQG